MKSKVSKQARYQNDLEPDKLTYVQHEQSGGQEQGERLFVSVAISRTCSASVSPKPSFINQTNESCCLKMINMAQMPVLLWCLPGRAGNLTYYHKCCAEIFQSSFGPPLNVCMDFQKNLKFQALAGKWLQPPFCFRQFPPHVEHIAVPRLSRADIKKQWDTGKQQGRATVKILAWASGNVQFVLYLSWTFHTTLIKSLTNLLACFLHAQLRVFWLIFKPHSNLKRAPKV